MCLMRWENKARRGRAKSVKEAKNKQERWGRTNDCPRLCLNQQTKNTNIDNFCPNTETLSWSYQAVRCAQAWRCWCPAGAPGSRCGRAAGWSPSWRRSRCPPRPPPCGTPPSPRPGGPPAASGGGQQSGENNQHVTSTDVSQPVVSLLAVMLACNCQPGVCVSQMPGSVMWVITVCNC